ncbi:MAG: N-acetyltransferase [Candidatus Hydrogenedentota bacterium]
MSEELKPTIAKAQIRMANVNDATGILGVYAPYCVKSPVTFEVQPPSVADMQHRIEAILRQYPFLVLEGEAGSQHHAGVDWPILAYAYGTKHGERAAYRFSTDVSIYVREDCIGKGCGKALYSVLLPLLAAQGYYKAFAGITVPNPGSQGLHTHMGFTPIGVFTHVGYKLGEWRDVAWYEKPLRDRVRNPAEPIPIAELLKGGPFAYLNRG